MDKSELEEQLLPIPYYCVILLMHLFLSLKQFLRSLLCKSKVLGGNLAKLY